MAKLRKAPPPASVSQLSRGSSSCSYSSARSNTTCSSFEPAQGQFTTLSPRVPSVSKAVSRTMAYARSNMNSNGADEDNMHMCTHQVERKLEPQGHTQLVSRSRPPDTYYNVPSMPRTANEQYWAARAYISETRLSEREGRARVEATSATSVVEAVTLDPTGIKMVKKDDLQEMLVSRLERLMTIWIACIGLIVTVLLLLTVVLFFNRNSDKGKHRAFRPHLTIPILSPFTSIVEHEQSSIGFRTVAVMITIFGVVAYFLGRRWLHQLQQRR